MDYCIAIDRLRPNAIYTRCNTYEELAATWADETPLPSDSELQAAYAEWEVEQIAVEHAAAVEAAAHDLMASLPGWATWTAPQCVAYIEANVTSLASAKLVLIHMAQAICYLRNQVWSDLED